MKFKYIAGAIGVMSGLFMATQTTGVLCFEPETNSITVQYTDISRVTVKDFTDKEGASLSVQLKKKVGTYNGTVNYKNISHPVSVEVVDQVAPVIIEVNGKYIGYDLLDGILECKVEGDKYVTTDKSGNKCEKTVVQAKTKKNGKVQSKPKVQSVQVKSNKPTQATGNIYSYRKLGNFPVLDKKLFGTDTQGMQKALESAGSYSVTSEEKAFKYTNDLYTHYGLSVPYTDNGKEYTIQFSSVKNSVLNENTLYQKKVDELAWTICGQGGDLPTLSMQVCQYFKSHYSYKQGQNSAMQLVTTGQGNCDAISRLTIDILMRYGLQGQQIGGNEHAWVGVAGCYIDPTFYMTSNGDSKYILSNEIWSDGQH